MAKQRPGHYGVVCLDRQHPGDTEYFDSDIISDKSIRAVSVSGLPDNGSTIYVELSTKTPAGTWIIELPTYTAAGGGIVGKGASVRRVEPGRPALFRVPTTGCEMALAAPCKVGQYSADGVSGDWVVLSYALDFASQLLDDYGA